ncbi:hypothetical protein [Pontibacter chitinilyticus]|uniref:hypothetical protein n=1 Tax=Pontibacter chitinilyticus TaxID=2674989 RepID=UPI00321BE1F4
MSFVFSAPVLNDAPAEVNIRIYSNKNTYLSKPAVLTKHLSMKPLPLSKIVLLFISHLGLFLITILLAHLCTTFRNFAGKLANV